MSFNRLLYDPCAYAADLKQSVSPLDYQLYDGKYINKKPCPCKNDKNPRKCGVNFGVRADTESELYNLTRPATLCPSKKYNPKQNNFNNSYHRAILCEGIYGITPTNIKRTTST